MCLLLLLHIEASLDQVLMLPVAPVPFFNSNLSLISFYFIFTVGVLRIGSNIFTCSAASCSLCVCVYSSHVSAAAHTTRCEQSNEWMEWRVGVSIPKLMKSESQFQFPRRADGRTNERTNQQSAGGPHIMRKTRRDSIAKVTTRRAHV